MKIFKRDKKRNKSKVKVDIEETKRIVREDIYDLLKESKDAGKTEEEAKVELAEFLKDLEITAIKKYTDRYGDIEYVVARILSDVGSYRLEWDE